MLTLCLLIDFLQLKNEFLVPVCIEEHPDQTSDVTVIPAFRGSVLIPQQFHSFFFIKG
jgi:hypothetical protein